MHRLAEYGQGSGFKACEIGATPRTAFLLPGRLGRLEPNEGHTLAVYTDRPRLLRGLWALPGVRPR